jgi:hypothetical protein
MLRKNSIKLIILIQRNIVYTQGVRKRIFATIFYESCEVGIPLCEEFECFFFRNRIDDNPSKCSLKGISESTYLDITRSIATLKTDRERNTIIDSFDKFF